MIKNELMSAFGIMECRISDARMESLARLASQTSLQERESLYITARHHYSGEGDIWDIGCAVGGSSYCLAAGLQDNELIADEEKSELKVKCFDLFEGYSRNAFRDRFPFSMSDLEKFHAQTADVHSNVLPIKINLLTDFNSSDYNSPVELAHIDAAKSLPLWKSIFKTIAPAIIPGKTIWIYQDFERARLPWQIYSMPELMRLGEIIGGADLGTVYFKFHSRISDRIRQKIALDAFSLEEKVNNIRIVFNELRSQHMAIFNHDQIMVNNLENTSLAYCYYWDNEKKMAQELLRKTSADYLSNPGNEVYSQEILESS